MVSRWSCPCVRPSVVRPSVFSFRDNNLRSMDIYQLYMYIAIIEVGLGIANGQTSTLTVICPHMIHMTGYYRFTFLFFDEVSIVFCDCGLS